MIPAGPVRGEIVMLAGLIDHARKYTWSLDPAGAEFIGKLDRHVVALAALMPENQEAAHVPGTG